MGVRHINLLLVSTQIFIIFFGQHLAVAMKLAAMIQLVASIQLAAAMPEPIKTRSYGLHLT